MKYEVYKIQNITNNKLYIGITNSGYKPRFRKHVSEMSHGSTFILHNAMRKYGIANFTTSLLEVIEDIETLKLREQYWIKTLDTTNRDFGYNMTLGGDGTFGRLHSQETKFKIADKAKGRRNGRRLNVVVVNLDSNIETLFESLESASIGIGKNKTYLAYYKSKLGVDEFIIDNLNFKIYKPILETTVKLKTQSCNPEHMQHIQKLAMQARRDNPEQYSNSQKIAKLESGKTKIVQQFTLDGDLIAEYFGTREAAKAVGGLRAPIKNCIKGNTKKSYGFVWKYK